MSLAVASDWAHAHATASLAMGEAHTSETPFPGHSWISVLVYATWASLNHLPSNVRVRVGSARAWSSHQSNSARARTRTRSHEQACAHLWLPQIPCTPRRTRRIARERAGPGSLRTSSTAIPHDLEKNKWTCVVRDGIKIGQGVLAGMRGSVSAGSGARLQVTLTITTLTASSA